MASKIIKRILIIKPSALGDIALALPALVSIRKSFPQAEITWLVRKEFAPLLEMTDNLDKTILFDRKLLGKWFRSRKAFVELISFFKILSSSHFDLVIDLQGLFRTGLFAWITGSSRRFGIKGAREFAGIFYTDRVAQDIDSIHLVDLNSKIISAAGGTEIVYDYGLTIDPFAESMVDQILAENDCGQKKYAVLVTGAAHSNKCWPIEKFAEIADRMHDQFGFSVIAIGMDMDKPAVEQLTKLAKTDVIDLTTKTNIKVLTALMSKAAMVISNDTGPGHIAQATGVPLVMIFGPTNPARIYPYKKPQSVAAIDPFTRGVEIVSVDARYAIENVTVNAVYEKVSALIGDKL